MKKLLKILPTIAEACAMSFKIFLPPTTFDLKQA